MSSDYIFPPPVDDEIILSLVEQKHVVHETVRITVTVSAQRDEKTNEADLRRSIRAALRAFINTESWRFLGVQRQRGQSRFEQVIVAAIARVPESENVQLSEKADAASTPELQLLNAQATYALPFDQVQAINRELRVKLVERAKAECALYNEGRPGGTEYRLGEVLFADTPRAAAGAQDMRAGRAYAAAAAGGQYSNAPGGGAEDAAEEGAPDLGVTERFWVAAQVTLKAKTE